MSHVHQQIQKHTYFFDILTHRFLTILRSMSKSYNIGVLHIYIGILSQAMQVQCNSRVLLISKGIKSLHSFTVIFIYINVSVFVYKVFFLHYFLCKASPQISKSSILWIIFPDYAHSAKLVYLRCYFEAAIACFFISLKVFCNYKKLTTKPTFPGKCFINKLL